MLDNMKKNIWVIPTNKPSKLCIINSCGELNYSEIEGLSSKHITNQHIYINNDEEIKKGDWLIVNDEDVIQIKYFYDNDMSGEDIWIGDSLNGYATNKDNCKKIILTTDQDLIKNGVQSIDDEFLQWFVNNSSCEQIEIKRNKKLSNKPIWRAKKGDLIFNNHDCGGVITILSNDVKVYITSENGEKYMETAITSDNGIDTLYINNYKIYKYTDYKVIIPKEKYRMNTADYIFENASLIDKEESKKETLEEAAKNYINNDLELYESLLDGHIYYNVGIDLLNNLFIAGAKWQAEKMYNEEFYSNLSDKFYESKLLHDYKDGKIDYRFIRKWFIEQSKIK